MCTFPWCLQKCPYCDFATEAIVPSVLPHERYARAVVRELELRKHQFQNAAPGPRTLFFGGGTPGLWSPSCIAAVAQKSNELFGSSVETTVECNPTALDETRAKALQSIGVHRLSIGVQSLREPHLRYLGRMHNAEEALRAVRAATSVSSLRVSADLMFGMPEQKPSELVEDALTLLSAGVEHLSVYSLTIEPATRFGELARKGKLPRLPDDSVAELYQVLEKTLLEQGLLHYEVSNYTKANAHGLHNQGYWRGAPYVGVGAAAVGCYTPELGRSVRYRNDPDPRKYMDSIEQNALAEETEALDAEALVREGLMLGLRTDEGVDVQALQARTGIDPYKGRERALQKAKEKGNLLVESHRWSIPQERWLLADDIIARLF